MYSIAMTRIARLFLALFVAALVGLILAIGAGIKSAHAEGVITGPDCSARWTAPSGTVQGYRIYVGATATTKTQRAHVASTSVQCSALNLVAGQHYVHVTAYNAAGESGASNTLPFVLVTAAPGVPTGLELVLP